MRNDRISNLPVALFSAVGVAGLLLAALAGGCSASANVDTKGWQEVAREYKDAYAGTGGEEGRAVQNAREAAIDAGLKKDRLSEYNITAAAKDDLWWVSFRQKGSDQKTWPECFVVRVARDNSTRLYKNPANAPEH
jgi:hypothetical protein